MSNSSFERSSSPSRRVTPFPAVQRGRLTRSTRVLSGVGLHTGSWGRVTIHPPETEGPHRIRFVLHEHRDVGLQVSLDAVRPSARRTVLAGDEGRSVSTVEHLLAALAGVGVFHADIHLAGIEVPALDGSCEPWVAALLDAGVERMPAREHPVCWGVTRQWSYPTALGGTVSLHPARELRIECHIDYAHPAIGSQRHTFIGPDPECFSAEIAPARTFGLLSEAESLANEGLALGATLECALVFGPEAPLNSRGLRFANEPVRHKVLDAIGDLALLGAPVFGQFRLIRCGHRDLIRALQAAVAARVLCRRAFSSS
jgi:UDP-3-O-[3-hydroxymyristoyl] N-acetylglucosamine deacetylase